MQFLADFLARVCLLWHRYVAPALPAACRHEPTCSQYAALALQRYGLWKGLGLSLHRLSRCHPWGSTGYDPVPEPGMKGKA